MVKRNQFKDLPVLFEHVGKTNVGKAEYAYINRNTGALIAAYRLDLENPLARNARGWIKDGLVQGVSLTHHIHTKEPLELSLCLQPRRQGACTELTEHNENLARFSSSAAETIVKVKPYTVSEKTIANGEHVFGNNEDDQNFIPVTKEIDYFPQANAVFSLLMSTVTSNTAAAAAAAAVDGGAIPPSTAAAAIPNAAAASITGAPITGGDSGTKQSTGNADLAKAIANAITNQATATLKRKAEASAADAMSDDNNNNQSVLERGKGARTENNNSAPVAAAVEAERERARRDADRIEMENMRNQMREAAEKYRRTEQAHRELEERTNRLQQDLARQTAEFSKTKELNEGLSNLDALLKQCANVPEMRTFVKAAEEERAKNFGSASLDERIKNVAYFSNLMKKTYENHVTEQKQNRNQTPSSSSASASASASSSSGPRSSMPAGKEDWDTAQYSVMGNSRFDQKDSKMSDEVLQATVNGAINRGYAAQNNNNKQSYPGEEKSQYARFSMLERTKLNKGSAFKHLTEDDKVTICAQIARRLGESNQSHRIRQFKGPGQWVNPEGYERLTFPVKYRNADDEYYY